CPGASNCGISRTLFVASGCFKKRNESAVEKQPESIVMKQSVDLRRQLIPAGLLCQKCGAAEFKTSWQQFAGGKKHLRADCARCGAFVRYLKQPGAPEPEYQPAPEGTHRSNNAAPPDSWLWIGMIRLNDGLWRAVATAPTLAKCWDVLLHYPGQG